MVQSLALVVYLIIYSASQPDLGPAVSGQRRLSDWARRPSARARLGFEQRRFELIDPQGFETPSRTSNRDGLGLRC